MIQSVQEPIEVITVFSDGHAQPLRFKWRGRVVKVSKVTGEWVRKEGESRIHYYSVLGGSSDYFEMAYDARRMQWTLAKVWLDGA